MRRGSDELQQWVRQPAAWVILLVGVLASVFAWRTLSLEIDHAARTSFDTTVTETRGAVESRLRGYLIVLYGLRGFVQSGAQVDRPAFKRYIDSVRAARGSSGIRSFSYAARVPHHERERFEAAVRSDTSIHPGGYPHFQIHPAGARPEYLVVHLLEPFGGNEASFGLDLTADTVRRASVERARDMDTAIATAPIALVSAPGVGAAGISIRLAVFRPEVQIRDFDSRKQAFAGLVSVTFLVHDVVDELVKRHAAVSLRLSVKDVETGHVLYGSGAGEPASDAFRARTPLEAGGRTWELEFSAPPRRFRTAGDALMPWLALVGGLLIALLLAGLVGSLATSTHRAHRIAHAITDDLRRSEAPLADAQQRTQLLLETLPNPVFFKGTDGRYLGVNRAWEAFFATPRDSIVGKTVFELYAHAPDIAARLDSMDQALWRNPGTQSYEARVALVDGTWRDTIYNKATFTGPDGRVAGLIGTIVDITQRKQAEKRQAMEHAVAQILSQAEIMDDAAPRLIQTVCETLGWACGNYWRWDSKNEELRCDQSWHIDAPEVAAFIAASIKTINEAPAWRDGVPRTATGGVVRRVWNTGSPVWFPDVALEPAFRRGVAAAEASLHSAFGFPVLSGGKPLGVMEFFSQRIEQPDEALLQSVRALGNQIGQFIVRKEAEEKVRFVASHDALTGLPNRIMFTQRLEHALAQAHRHGRRLAVLFIDLDRFKLINDTLGHDAGDTVLRAVAARLSEKLRASDSVGRLGGDEFVVLLEELPEAHYVAGVAQKLIDALARSFVLGGREYHLSGSIGVSTYPDDATTMQDLLKNADIAMYRAKEHGRNTFQFYSEQMNVHSVERLSLESELRRGIEREELVLHFQPQASVRGATITGVEALVRWQHPEQGLLPPHRFIPLAEESGLVVALGEWVLRTACARVQAWAQAGVAVPRMAVNLSPRQFLQGDLTAIIERSLAQTGCPPGLLELEITESMVMHNPERAVELMHRIRAIGVKVAIDDFGTGYSSLGALKRFPVDRLKVDRSFIHDIPRDRDDAAITQAVIVMAHSLGMKVTAKGVETADQLEFLRTHGCDEMQGFYVSKPLPEAELLAFLRSGAPLRQAN
ncbi:MAG: bifunctional diguanylate cyclase/phosphodiesterase [Betaproteobacteria bacterium]